MIGRMRADDPRSRHVSHFLDVVERLAPRAFVMENVKSLGANPRWEPLRAALLARAKRMGYSCRLTVLNAAHFGVPQARERMFLVGLAGAVRPPEPVPTTAQAPPTVRDALALLPHFGEPGNDTVSGARVVPSAIPVMRPTAHRGSLLFNGSGRPVDLDKPAKTLPASMGGNATPIIDQDQLDHGSEPWVVGYHRHLAEGGEPLRVAPDRLRRLTVEEAAVLQSFPVGYRFLGARVGSVPPGRKRRPPAPSLCRRCGAAPGAGSRAAAASRVGARGLPRPARRRDPEGRAPRLAGLSNRPARARAPDARREPGWSRSSPTSSSRWSGMACHASDIRARSSRRGTRRDERA